MQLRFPADVPLPAFLSDYWQQQPLLMRRAFPDLTPPIDADGLAGLALEDAIESRIVSGNSDTGWRLRHGPFDAEDFRHLPATDWSLLVQDVDKTVPAAATLLRSFDFLPSWRLDDLMVSFAVDGGSVGPHIDNYDVFLIQTAGTRQWQIGETLAGQPRLVSDSELQVLAEFDPTQDWSLEPGDVLYLPPGVPHWGIARGDCMTCSAGFRAPSARELLQAWCDRKLASVSERQHYRDPPLQPGLDPGVIPPAALDELRVIFSDLLRVDNDMLLTLFGDLVTEPKPHLQPRLPYRDWTTARLAEVKQLQVHPAARFALTGDKGSDARLHANGTSHALTAHGSDCARLLCRRRLIDSAALTAWRQCDRSEALLIDLLNEGLLEPTND